MQNGLKHRRLAARHQQFVLSLTNDIIVKVFARADKL